MFLVSAVGGEAVNVTASQYSAYPACSGGKEEHLESRCDKDRIVYLCCRGTKESCSL